MEKFKSLLYCLAALVVLVLLARFLSLNISLILLSVALLGTVYWNDKVDKLDDDHITSLSRIAVIFAGWAAIISFKTFFGIIRGIQAGDVFGVLGCLILIVLAVAIFISGMVVYLFQKSEKIKFGYLLVSLLIWCAFYWLLSFGYNDVMFGQQQYDWMLK